MSADWYVDPLGRFEGRFFDGVQWTGQVSVHGHLQSDPDWPLTAVDAVARQPATWVGTQQITGAERRSSERRETNAESGVERRHGERRQMRVIATDATPVVGNRPWRGSN